MEDYELNEELISRILAGKTGSFSDEEQNELRKKVFRWVLNLNPESKGKRRLFTFERNAAENTKALEDYITQHYSYSPVSAWLLESRSEPESVTQIKKIENEIEGLRSHVSTLAYDQREILEAIYDKIGALTDTTNDISAEIHERSVPLSFGINESDFPLRRFVPVRVYLSEYIEDEIPRIIVSIGEFISSLGYLFSDDFPSERGSWWKSWLAKSRRALTSEEVKEGLEKGQRALELATIEKAQSEVNKNHAEAASNLINSLSQVDNAAIQIGSLLLVKVTNGGTTSVHTRQMTQKEMIALEKNQSLMRKPEQIIQELEKLSCDNAA